ncbi:hypothetical protein B0J12DRAFT_332965 [Macrophomina phaseolina]|uniref:Uncharacterized protein n=1 Tax=Macrophomina phaseolina TaxID=35725 RepID=A0ABQ8GLC1_9PEZI|nr:hypothetical protein B0J12DRAFT_332965 [Macrophomina phaseolina]
MSRQETSLRHDPYPPPLLSRCLDSSMGQSCAPVTVEVSPKADSLIMFASLHRAHYLGQLRADHKQRRGKKKNRFAIHQTFYAIFMSIPDSHSGTTDSKHGLAGHVARAQWGSRRSRGHPSFPHGTLISPRILPSNSPSALSFRNGMASFVASLVHKNDTNTFVVGKLPSMSDGETTPPPDSAPCGSNRLCRSVLASCSSDISTSS